MKTFIIGEIGSNHDGSLERAKALIDIASLGGCDAAKFQLIPPFKKAWIDPLIEHCKKRSIEFMATPFNQEGIDAIRGKVKHWKVASTEAADIIFLQKVFDAAGDDIVFVSDGATGYLEFAENNYIPMSCVVAYPANMADYTFYTNSFTKWGLSDHTTNVHFGAVAVAAGAIAVEKHITDDSTRKGPDHAFSITLPDLQTYVMGIRNVETIFRDNKKKINRTHVGRKLQWP